MLKLSLVEFVFMAIIAFSYFSIFARANELADKLDWFRNVRPHSTKNAYRDFIREYKLSPTNFITSVIMIIGIVIPLVGFGYTLYLYSRFKKFDRIADNQASEF